MSVAVIIPWRPDRAERSRNWTWLRKQWEQTHPDWEIIEGHCPNGPWIKARAVHDALKRTTAETLVIADADIWCSATTNAVDALHHGATWAIPHTPVHRLTPEITTRLVDGTLDWDDLQHAPTTQRPYTGIAGGGIITIRRDAYEQAPFDPRFNGWGGEDSAAGITWTALHGTPWRGTAPLWHLWHPPQPRITRVKGSQGSADLLTRYKATRHDPQGIQALIAEATEAP